MKSVLLFLATFILGAALAFATRTALHEPYAKPVALKSEISDLKSDAATVVNTVCAICGMDVDPDIQPATYQGKLVGFGCAACPPKFAKDPDRYGPSALRNEVTKK
jgi:hypothetical protein